MKILIMGAIGSKVQASLAGRHGQIIRVHE